MRAIAEPARLPSQPLMSARAPDLEAALVHEHHDRLDALRAQLRARARSTVVRLVAELQARDAGRRDDRGRGLERHADEGHRRRR